MKSVVTIGGGTGTFVVLSALKQLPEVSPVAIVSAADDGGSKGRLRDAYGFLPPGDARQALVALAEDGTTLRDLFAYRFHKSDVEGHTLGNLFLTALSDLLGSGPAAIAEAGRILRIKGEVISATDTPTELAARLVDGTILRGEHAIDERVSDRARIETLFLSHPTPLAKHAARAIEQADYLVFGPGDLYTSSVAALLADGMQGSIRRTNAKLVYVANLFTKRGQTDGYTVARHLEETARYAGRMPELVYINTAPIPADVRARYEAAGEFPVVDDLPHDAVGVYRVPLIETVSTAPVLGDTLVRSFIRHDPTLLAAQFVKHLV